MTPADALPKRRRAGRTGSTGSVRVTDYRTLRNPFPPVAAFSEDEIAAMHDASLRVLEELGVKVLLPEARQLFRAAGAKVDDATEMVFIGREIVAAALNSAPRSINLRAGHPDRDLVLELGTMTFQPGAGAPNATDLVRGRRPGSARDFCELIQLTQSFDALHLVPPLVEPQDVPMHLRHYMTMEAILTLSDKVPFVYARGTPQVRESFEMLRDFRGLSDAEFAAQPQCYTVINTNSPRQIDIPMANGLIDFARAGQVAVVTPFTLMGAMAPITVAGAITLSHAEAMAGITLNQIARPGAPVLYGTFTSNVDMKSGSPAFGTPEHFRASLAAGQMARLIGLPWRCASGSAANINDAQAAHETQFGLWGCVMAGATTILHAAGWLEGGLSISYEKLITDMEAVNMIADLCTKAQAGPDEIGFDAIAEVEPGGHFFAAAQTMARYQTEFYQPVVADRSNFGTWSEHGAMDANHRATAIWQEIVARNWQAPVSPDQVDRLQSYIRKRTAEGGAPPES